MVGLEGFEPPTHGLGNRCSIRLSYRPMAPNRMGVYRVAQRHHAAAANFVRRFLDGTFAPVDETPFIGIP